MSGKVLGDCLYRKFEPGRSEGVNRQERRMKRTEPYRSRNGRYRN